VTIFLSRQIAASFYRGNIADINGAEMPEWNLNDVYAKYKLALGDGECTGGYIPLAASASTTLALPDDYTSASRLGVMILTSGNARVTVASPDHANSIAVLRGSGGAPGVFSVTDTVTSITIVNPTSAIIFVDYLLYKLPDLTDVDSYRGGLYNYGSVS
jgi:hypothetical protein